MQVRGRGFHIIYDFYSCSNLWEEKIHAEANARKAAYNERKKEERRAKARDYQTIKRSSMTSSEAKDARDKNREYVAAHRARKKEAIARPNETQEAQGFRPKHSLGKAVKRMRIALPRSIPKQVEVLAAF